MRLYSREEIAELLKEPVSLKDAIIQKEQICLVISDLEQQIPLISYEITYYKVDGDRLEKKLLTQRIKRFQLKQLVTCLQRLDAKINLLRHEKITIEAAIERDRITKRNVEEGKIKNEREILIFKRRVRNILGEEAYLQLWREVHEEYEEEKVMNHV